MKWLIVSDSSCDIRTLDGLAPGVEFGLVPFKINIGSKEFVDLPGLDTAAMLQAMTEHEGASTSACPSPGEWAAWFEKADNVIALTISSNLSGSYAAAMAARDIVLEASPNKKIFVLDTLSDAGALASAAELANRLIGEGKDFDAICKAIKKFNDAGHIMFALSSFENLVKNGRVSRVVGFIAGHLHMRVLGRRTADGRIDFFFKTRGEHRVLARILEEMASTGFDGTRPVVIGHCLNPEAAETLRRDILARWAKAKITVIPLAGLCSFYAQQQGVIITY